VIKWRERSLMASFLVGHHELSRLLGDSIEETGLSALDAVALRAVILNPSVTVGGLATMLALRASSASYLVDRLVSERFAVRESSPFDRRIALVRLTGLGDQAARMVDTAIRELEREILAIAETDADAISGVVDGIELLASRERRLRLRSW
jgi:DNA-binding MarR family transcriptional regulator